VTCCDSDRSRLCRHALLTSPILATTSPDTAAAAAPCQMSVGHLRAVNKIGPGRERQQSSGRCRQTCPLAGTSAPRFCRAAGLAAVTRPAAVESSAAVRSSPSVSGSCPLHRCWLSETGYQAGTTFPFLADDARAMQCSSHLPTRSPARALAEFSCARVKFRVQGRWMLGNRYLRLRG
jgi:hypothetical protein